MSQLIGNPYMFTGRRLDPETFEATPDSMGLYYYRARMYNPQFGRFMQPDPIGYADAMNLYQYCGNNAVNWIDPWGLCKQELRDKMLAEKKKILAAWKQWCKATGNPMNRATFKQWVTSLPYHHCGTHALSNQNWFDDQGYECWKAVPEMRHRHLWWGLWIRQNHQVLTIYPKDAYEGIADDESFVLDSWLWDTEENWDDWLERWPDEEHG